MRHAIAIAIAAIAACGAPEDGVDGADGKSCTVERQTDGVLVRCGDGSSALIRDAANGSQMVSRAFCLTRVNDSHLVGYSRAIMADGSSIVTGFVAGARRQSSATQFYLPQHEGSSTGFLAIVSDEYGIDNYGIWTLRHDSADNRIDIEYSDTELAEPMTWTSGPDDCTTEVAQ